MSSIELRPSSSSSLDIAPKLDEAIEAFNIACTVFTTDNFQEGVRHSFESTSIDSNP